VRRLLLVLMLVALPFPGGQASSQGTAPDEAARFLDALGHKAIAVLGNQSTTLEQREAQVRALLSENFDLKTIGRFVLGRAWRKASPGQQAEYQRLFEEYVLRTYTRRLGGYAGEKFRIVKAQPLGDKDALVTTEIGRPSGPPLLAGWRVRNSGNGHKILDVMVQGVSMAQTQRSEFSALVRRQGVDGLIEALRARVEKFSARAS